MSKLLIYKIITPFVLITVAGIALYLYSSSLLHELSILMVALLVGIFSAVVPFACVQRLTGAKWSLSIESMAFRYKMLPFAVMFIIPLLFFEGYYTDLNDGWRTQSLGFILNEWIVLITYGVILLIYFWNRISSQKNLLSAKKATMSLILYVFTGSLFAYALAGSGGLTHSGTLFGLYYLLSSYVVFLALISIIYLLSNHNPVRIYELMKLLFAANALWAYFFLMQYIIISYARIPSEVIFYHSRSYHVLSAVIILHFVVPFPLLLSRAAKENRSIALTASTLILIGGILEFIWLWAPVSSLSVAFLAALLMLLVIIGYAFTFQFRNRKQNNPHF
ncbi:MAG: hypothetical protein ACLFQX_02850 [Candidatus Kapaibacterium sp.]